MRAPGFRSAAHRQSLAVARSKHALEDQAFIKAVSDWEDEWDAGKSGPFSGGRDYAGKPRPAVILQDDNFDATNSITICAFTTDPTDAPLFRLSVEPNERNGLRVTCRLMVDNITTVAKSRLGWLPPSTAVGFSSSLGRWSGVEEIIEIDKLTLANGASLATSSVGSTE
jgi:hypothetical protein